MSILYIHTLCKNITNNEIEVLTYFGDCKETNKDLELINIIVELIDSNNNFKFKENILEYFDNYNNYYIFMQKYFKCIPTKIYSIKLLKTSNIIDIHDNKKS